MNEVTRHFCWHENFVPWGLSAPAPGLYTCIKSWKNQISKRFFWNLQQMSKWHVPVDIKIFPKGLSAPAPGLYKCIKLWFFFYKIRLQRDLFETCSKWPKWQEVSVDIKILSPGVVSTWPAANLSNDDPGLTMTIFMTGSNLFLMLLYGWQLIEHLVLLYF